MKNFLEINANKHKTYQNLWNTVKAVIREKFTALNAYIYKREMSQRSNNASWKKNKNKSNPKTAGSEK